MFGLNIIKPYNPIIKVSAAKESDSAAFNKCSAAIAPLKSDTVAFSGRGIDVTRYNKLLREIQNTSEDAICSLEDAVKEFEVFNISNEMKANYILACAYKGYKADVVINKKALLSLKRKMLEIQAIPDLAEGIKKCVDSKHKLFDSKKFKDLFDIRKRAKIMDVEPSYRSGEYRYAEEEKKNRILGVLSSQSKSVNFQTCDFFKPISDLRVSVLKGLYEAHVNNSELPESLYFKMLDEIQKNNFDLSKIYTDYYSKLNECRTLAEVKKIYPELKFVDKKPEYKKGSARMNVNNLLSYSKYSYEKAILSALRQGNVDLIPKNSINVQMHNHQMKSLLSLKIAGFDVSTPSDELLKVFKECKDIINKYGDMPQFDTKTLNDIAMKEAINKSRYWADYREMTANDVWMPIRFIRNKKDKPNETYYTTDRLINQYLAGLYLKGHGVYSSNPLNYYDGINKLTSDMINIIDYMYMPLYRKTENINKVDKEGFEEFVKRFDRAAMARSINHIEKVFHSNFMAMYNSGERLERYYSELKKAKELIQEKIKLSKEIVKAKQEMTLPKKETWVQGDLFGGNI